MSKHTTKTNEKRIQFIVKKEDIYFDIISKIEDVYPAKNRSDSIKLALRDFYTLLESYECNSFEELLKKLISGDSNSKIRELRK